MLAISNHDENYKKASSRIKVMHSLKSKNVSQWFNNYKTIHIITPQSFWVELQFCSGITSSPTA